MDKDELNELSNRIIGAAIEVHKTLGPGLLEKAYKESLLFELRLRKMKVVKELPIPCIYKGVPLDCSYQADLVVEDSIIIELKSTEKDSPIFAKQLQTYLRLADKRLGLLINFNHILLCDGITRVVNNF